MRELDKQSSKSYENKKKTKKQGQDCPYVKTVLPPYITK